MESIKICRFKTFRVGYKDKKLSSPSLFIIYIVKIFVKIVFCIAAGKFQYSLKLNKFLHKDPA